MSDVEPKPPYPGAPSDRAKQGGLKDPDAKPAPEKDDSGAADVETEEDIRGDRGGGMIGEG